MHTYTGHMKTSGLVLFLRLIPNLLVKVASFPTLLFLVHPVCVPQVPMAIKSVSCWSGYSFEGLIKTDQLVTIYAYYACNELKALSYGLGHNLCVKISGLLLLVHGRFPASYFNEAAIQKQHHTSLSKYNVKPIFIYI